MNNDLARRRDKVLINAKPMGFGDGLGSIFSGFRLLVAEPRFLLMCFAPWVLTVLVILPFSSLISGKVVYPFLRSFLPDGSGIFSQSVSTVGGLILLPAVIVGTILFALVLTIIIAAPIHDLMGERIEQWRLRGRPDLLPPEITLLQGILFSFRDAILRLLLALPFFILALLLGIIPVIGPPLAIALNAITAATFISLDAFGMPMARRGISLPRRLKWVWHNRLFALGFGLPLLIVPCAIFLMPPIAAVGASLAYSDYLLRYSPSDHPDQGPFE